jgi:isopenicillin N synthase-like dioxygenase
MPFSFSTPFIVPLLLQVKDACLRCGFFMIKNHGADETAIAKAWGLVQDFFDLPLEKKNDVVMDGTYPYGYSPINTEIAGGVLDYGKADQKESFSLCLGPTSNVDPRMPTPRWPKEAPIGFKEALSAYYRECEKLADTLLAIFATALELPEPETYFKRFDNQHWSALRALNYPHSEKTFAPGQLRIGEHSDYGALTILRGVGAGLQVLRKDGSWADVDIPEKAFTINLGDLMQRWTNDLWKSTRHRVVPPVLQTDPSTGRIKDNRRQSIAFFHNLNRDAIVEVFPTCISEERPCRYGPINAFDHLMESHAKAIGATNYLSSTGEADAKLNADDQAKGQKVGGADITGSAWKAAAAADGESKAE